MNPDLNSSLPPDLTPDLAPDFLSISDNEVLIFLKKNNLKLTPDELRKIQTLLKRPPTISECVLWSIQGSEHCSYKSTRVHLKTLHTDAPNVILGPKEDAGVVEVAKDHSGHRYGIVMSHESHNHPSQIVPFEGAATGVGGNVRDVSCMGAEVIALADTLRFGDINNPKTYSIDHGVVSGIAGYGNPIGVPNLAGDVFYDPAYQDNCLVTVISLGIVRDDELIHSYPPKNIKNIKNHHYDLILIGKPTDNSGFGGASFASVDLDLNQDQAQQNKGAVQEPNAFLGRHLLKTNTALFKKLAAQNLIHQVGFKDLGAGGIACASVEIADAGGYGAEVYLDQVHTSMKNLTPTVILCAETQERYLWAVPHSLTPLILEHYNQEWQLPQVSQGAEARVIGKIRTDGQYLVKYKDQLLISAKASDITQGIIYNRPHWPDKNKDKNKIYTNNFLNKNLDHKYLLNLLSDPNLSSRKPIYEHYDKQVQGRVILERCEASAGVMAPFNSSDYPEEIRQTGIALSVAHDPRYGKIGGYFSAYHAIISSMQKVIAVGAKPSALTDCLCFGNPEKPEQMHEIVEAIRGIKEACEAVPLFDHPTFPTPVISGNVSLYNETNQTPIPASPIVSCLGVLEDINLLMTPDFKQSGSVLFLIGLNIFSDNFLNNFSNSPKNIFIKNLFFAMINLIRTPDLKPLACQILDQTSGGLSLGLIKMSFKNQIGFELDLKNNLNNLNLDLGFILEIAPEKIEKTKNYFSQKNLDLLEIGWTVQTPESQPPKLDFQSCVLELSEAEAIYFNSLRDLRA